MAPDDSRRFFVGIPTLSRYDLLSRCISSFLAGTAVPERIFVIDNGGRWPGYSDNRVEVIRPVRNIGVAASWNVIHSLCHPCPVIVANDDVKVNRDTCDRILSMQEDCIRVWPFCLFLIQPHVWTAVGRFDEHFYPACKEDDDYIRRLRLAGFTLADLPTDAIHHAQGASFAAMTPEQRQEFDDWHRRGEEYYRFKWGGMPRQERFNKPFGDPTAVDWAARS